MADLDVPCPDFSGDKTENVSISARKKARKARKDIRAQKSKQAKEDKDLKKRKKADAARNFNKAVIAMTVRMGKELQDACPREGPFYPRPLHVPAKTNLMDGFYYPHGLMYSGISKRAWKFFCKSLVAHINPHRNWVGFVLSLPLIWHPVVWIALYEGRLEYVEGKFNEKIETTLDILAEADKSFFRPLGLLVRLEIESDQGTMNCGDLLHFRRNRVDDMTPLLTTNNPDHYGYLRDARERAINRPRLVIAPLSILENISRNNIWSIWGREAANRRKILAAERAATAKGQKLSTEARKEMELPMEYSLGSNLVEDCEFRAKLAPQSAPLPSAADPPYSEDGMKYT